MNRFKFFSWITFCLLLGSFANIALLVGCAYKYVEIEDPSKKIELDCFSITPPWEAKWYKVPLDLNMNCENGIRLVSGGGKDIYIVEFRSRIETWKDKFGNKYLLDEGEKFIKSQEKILERHIEYENINFDNEVVEGVKDICAKMKTEYSFSTSEPFYYKTRGQTGETIEFVLNPSDKYFLESIEFSVIEGPYKTIIFNSALIYQIKFTHLSVYENGDPELEAKALTFLENVEVTVDWEKVEVE